VLKHGVTKEALLHPLDSSEVDQMAFHGGFEPRQAYDGFISKTGDWYERGLCKEGKETHRKNKKDAPRHLRKFQFGLGTRIEFGALSEHLSWRLVEFCVFTFLLVAVNVYIPTAKRGCRPVAVTEYNAWAKQCWPCFAQNSLAAQKFSNTL
jgi:hypothetical protein